MNLLDQPREQVKDLADWMRDVGALKSPGPAQWEEISQGLLERALFLESFVLEKIANVPRHLFEGKEKSFFDNLSTPIPPVPPAEPIPFMQNHDQQPAPNA